MRSLLAIVALLCVAGCSQDVKEPVASETKQPVANAPAETPMGNSEVSADDAAKLADLEQKYKEAKAAYDKDSKDAKLKQAYVDATVKYGHESMMSGTLPQRIKYKQALGLYREALKLDPKNKVALQESALIVDIYKQMGRPVPEG